MNIYCGAKVLKLKVNYQILLAIAVHKPSPATTVLSAFVLSLSLH